MKRANKIFSMVIAACLLVNIAISGFVFGQSLGQQMKPGKLSIPSRCDDIAGIESKDRGDIKLWFAACLVFMHDQNMAITIENIKRYSRRPDDKVFHPKGTQFFIEELKDINDDRMRLMLKRKDSIYGLRAYYVDFSKKGIIDIYPKVRPQGPARMKTKPAAVNSASSDVLAGLDAVTAIAGEAGGQIPTFEGECYRLLLTEEFFVNGELKTHQRIYGSRFELDKFDTVGKKKRFPLSDEEIVAGILEKARGKEARTVALVPDSISPDELKKLTDAGIRLVRVKVSMLRSAQLRRYDNPAARVYRENFQTDTYAMMLLVRHITRYASRNTAVYRLLSFYLKSHFEFGDPIAVDDYIKAIVADDSMAYLIQGCLSYRPASPYDASVEYGRYKGIATALIWA